MALSIAEVLGASRPLTIEGIRLRLIERGWSPHLKLEDIAGLAIEKFPERFQEVPGEPSRWTLTPSEFKAYHQRQQPSTPSETLTSSVTAQAPQRQDLVPDTCFRLNDRYGVVVADLPGTDQVWVLLEDAGTTTNVRLHGPTVAKYAEILPAVDPAATRLRAAAALARRKQQPPLRSEDHPRRLSWRLLPPGEMVLSELREHLAAIRRQEPHRRWDRSRLEYIASLRPDRVYVGIEEYRQYFAFEFEKANVAVLDCPLYGNALYVLDGDDWQALSQLTKLELIKSGHACRIIHTSDEGWQSRLRRKLSGPTARRTKKVGKN